MATHRAKKPTRWALVIGINLSLVLLAAVLASEWFIARKAKTTLLYNPNPDYRHDLVPDQHMSRDGVEYHVGAHGMRGDPPSIPKPADEIRIVVMGGSSVFDHAVSPSWPERLETELHQRGIPNVRVMNAGVPGFSTREILPFFESKVRPFEPTFVVLYAGWNDAKIMRASLERLTLEPYPSAGSFDEPYAFLRAPRPRRNWYALAQMFEKLQLRTRVVVEEHRAPTPLPESVENRAQSPMTSEGWSATPGLAYWRSNLVNFVRMVRSARATPVLVAEATLVASDLSEADRHRVVYAYVNLDHRGLVAVQDAMASAVKEVSEQESVLFLHPRERLNGRSEYFLDHVHLTDQGSEALAKVLAAQLAPTIQR